MSVVNVHALPDNLTFTINYAVNPVKDLRILNIKNPLTGITCLRPQFSPNEIRED